MKNQFIQIVCLIMSVLMMLTFVGCDKNSESEPLDTSVDLSDVSNLKVTIKNNPTLTYTKESNPNFNSSGHSKLSLWTETSPCVYTLNGVTRTVITNSKTISFDMISGKNLLEKNHFDSTTGKLAVWPNVVDPNTNSILLPDEVSEWNIWRTVYYGLFSVWSDETTTYSIIHGENKNIVTTVNGVDYFYNNTVKPADTQYTPEQYSGYNGQGDDWENYFAFLCSASGSNEEVAKTGNLMINDHGPIVWPDGGYLDAYDNSNISTGPRHPCTLVYDDYIYVFYLIEMGGGGTIRVARAPVSGGAKPGTFKKYYNGAFDQNALPENFDKNDRNMVYQCSGMSSPIVDSINPIQFAVAHVKDTDYFVGILEETDGNGHFTSISVSKDLVNWTDPQEIAGTRCEEGWESGYLHYPKIYSKDFSTSMEVDASGFFVTGTSSNYGGWMLPQYMPLVIEIAEE